MKSSTWYLQGKAGRRFRLGHPWVFANELKASPKGIEPGSPIELRDERGEFLARGYGNPHSLIAFRVLSRRESEINPWQHSSLAEKIISAAYWRRKTGLGEFSHRMVFGEADQLPGLVIDRFLSDDGKHQILVPQILTAGMEKLIGEPADFFPMWVEKATGITWAQTTLIIRRDVGARKLEGLKIDEPLILQPSEKYPPESFPARVQSGTGAGTLIFTLNLISGQKTGFFFDQAGNVRQLLSQLKNWQAPMDTPLNVLDMFCYVGQWGTQVSGFFKAPGHPPTVHLVDASAPALKLAAANVAAAGGTPVIYELDIMEGLSGVPDCDVVICDPPAFIKSKKDHAAGLKGYVKANALALRKLKPGGWFVTCSCSHHLSDEDFSEVLRLAENRAETPIRWVARGIQAADHPIRMAFPEGQYLKCWIGMS